MEDIKEEQKKKPGRPKGSKSSRHLTREHQARLKVARDLKAKRKKIEKLSVKLHKEKEKLKDTKEALTSPVLTESTKENLPTKVKEFLEENMASIAMHRGPRSFEESDGKYKLAFTDDGSHPQGRAVSMGGDGMSSFYRIKDGRIQQINRKTPRMSFTINVEESV